MSSLAAMMMRGGLLSEGQVSTVRAHAINRSIPIVDSILELGLADEDTLVAFFASKLMIPKVRTAVLDRLSPDTVRALSPELAWRHSVLPVSSDNAGNMTLAMADPTDVTAVEDVARHTGAYLVRAIAPVAALRQAMQRHYGPPPEVVDPEATHPGMSVDAVRDTPAPTMRPAPAPVTVPEPTPIPPPQTPNAPPPMPDSPALSRPESIEAVHGFEAPPAAPDRDPEGERPRSYTPTNWTPDGLSGPAAEPTPLSPEAFGQVLPRLVGATTRDEITRLLLDFLGAGFGRVILFVHSRNELRGHDARGKDLLVDAVRQVRIPSGGESVFASVLTRAKPFFGRMPSETEIDRAFSQALGGISGNVLLLPVKLGSKVPLLLFAYGSSHPVNPRSINELAEGVSNGLSRIIARSKSRFTPPGGVPT